MLILAGAGMIQKISGDVIIILEHQDLVDFFIADGCAFVWRFPENGGKWLCPSVIGTHQASRLPSESSNTFWLGSLFLAFDQCFVISRIGQNAEFQGAHPGDKIGNAIGGGLVHVGYQDFHPVGAIFANVDFLDAAGIDALGDGGDDLVHIRCLPGF